MVEILDEPACGRDELVRVVVPVDPRGERPGPRDQASLEVEERLEPVLGEEAARGDAPDAVLADDRDRMPAILKLAPA
jgi:hypothetical protein